MKQNDAISPRQFVAVGFVAVLSPLIRRFPRTLAGAAGRTAWLAVPMAALPIALALLMAWLLFHKRPEHTGFHGLLTAALGPRGGRLATGFYTLWLLFYAGFLLKSGAIRFVSTVYQGAAPWLFVVCMALLCGVAALGSLKAIARSAMVLRPVLIAVLFAIFLLTVKDADFSLLLPVTAADILPTGYAALKIANLVSVAGYFSFFGDRVERRFRLRDCAGWIAVLLLVVAGMTVGCLGMFGPEMAAKMSYPFFMLARDVTVLGSLERVETVVVAVWVFSDFIMISALLWISARNLRFCFSIGEPEAPAKITDLRRGRWTAPLCTALAVTAAILTPRDISSYYRFSELVVPLCSAAVSFGLTLLILLTGKLRKKI